MESSESGASSDRTEPEGPGAKAPLDLATSESTRARRRSWTIVLAAGVLAGLVAWAAGELAHGYFRPRRYNVEIMGMTSMQPSRESQKAADLANAMLASAILGSVTAFAMGVAGGLASFAPRRGAVIGLGAQAVGTLAGGAVALALIPVLYWQLVPDLNDLLTPILIHGGIWAAIGAVSGTAFAAGMGRRRQLPLAALSAAAGAFTASIVFHLLVGMLFPQASAAEPVGGSSLIRLLATSLVAVMLAIGAGRGTLGRETDRAGA